jgi:hypothetical protein
MYTHTHTHTYIYILTYRIFKNFPEIGGLDCADDGNIIGCLSQALKLTAASKPVFKSDGNLDFNMGKTMMLGKGPSGRHVYQRVQYVLQNDPELKGIKNDFTPDMFSVQGIAVLGTPLGTEAFIKDFVTHICIKIARNVEKFEPITDGFVFHHLIKFCMNTYRHVDTTMANAILKKGTRGSFHQWTKDDYDLAVTVIQKPHAQGGFGITPNVLAQTSAKVAIASRFLTLVGSFSLEEQKLWFPNQSVHDPDTWTAPHLLHLKSEYDVLVNKHGCIVQEMYKVPED